MFTPSLEGISKAKQSHQQQTAPGETPKIKLSKIQKSSTKILYFKLTRAALRPLKESLQERWQLHEQA